MYAMATRPDISFAVIKLSKFGANPSMAHYKALKRVLVCLYTTRQRSLVMGRFKADYTTVGGVTCNDRNPLSVAVDADHGGCKDTAKSTSGGSIKCYGDLVWAMSRRQKKVTSSTAAAELEAMGAVLRRVTNLREAMRDLGCYQETVPIGSDSTAAIAMLKRGAFSSKSRHMLITFHAVLEKIADKEVLIYHLPGDVNTADIFTKPLPRAPFELHTANLLNDLGTHDYTFKLLPLGSTSVVSPTGGNKWHTGQSVADCSWEA